MYLIKKSGNFEFTVPLFPKLGRVDLPTRSRQEELAGTTRRSRQACVHTPFPFSLRSFLTFKLIKI